MNSKEPSPPNPSSDSDSKSALPIPSSDAEAVDCVADFSKGIDGLLPAIAQDADSGEVLMMAWMNRDALDESLETGRATYYSRSRGRLWRKGESSGHQQLIRELRVDCDRDTILLKVSQTGAACHMGYASCFYRRATDGNVLEIVESRLVDPESVYGKRPS